MLAGRHMAARQPALSASTVRAGASAVADPDCTRAQYAPQLASARQIGSVTGPQREVLLLARQIAAVQPGWPRGPVCVRIAACPWRLRRPQGGRRAGDPVIRVRPGGRLCRVQPRAAQPVREQGQLVAAALADRGKGNGVPGQIQRDLEWLARPVPARDRCHGQH